jgi:type II secretory pathway predicted ATPase ExeA
MYRKHFALTRHPFGQEIAPDELFPSASSRELDVRLAHLLDLRGIGLVTGDSGSGKTCAARRVLTQLHTGLYRTMTVHEALAQRIVVRYHMAALTREELTGYLTHRLHLAGAEVPLFDPSAEEAIYQATGGLPRKINLLAHHTLLAAALTRAKLATADHVQAALPEVA